MLQDVLEIVHEAHAVIDANYAAWQYRELGTWQDGQRLVDAVIDAAWVVHHNATFEA